MNRYEHWQAIARRLARHADDSEDLLQEALLAAVLAGRKPLEDGADAAWFRAVLSNLAAMQARTAVREQRRREAVLPPGDPIAANREPSRNEIARNLPRGLRRVLVLALSGLDRAEVQQVLGISDEALRQRLSALRERLRQSQTTDGLSLAAAYAERLAQMNPPDGGHRRAALARGPMRLPGFRFGVSDADGNLLAMNTEKSSQKTPLRQQMDEPGRGGDPEPGETPE